MSGVLADQQSKQTMLISLCLCVSVCDIRQRERQLTLRNIVDSLYHHANLIELAHLLSIWLKICVAGYIPTNNLKTSLWTTELEQAMPIQRSEWDVGRGLAPCAKKYFNTSKRHINT